MTILFQDDFKTGYSYTPKITQTGTSGAVTTAIGANWQVDFETSRGYLDFWPPDNSKYAFSEQYLNPFNGSGYPEDSDIIQYKFDPNQTINTGRPTNLYVQWKEYRSSTFDFGTTKDWRINLFTAGHWGSSHDQPGGGCEVYGGWGATTVSDNTSVDDVDTTGIFIQGNYFDQSAITGDGNQIWRQSITPTIFPRASIITIELHFKVNTPGNSDGAAEMWINGTRMSNSRTNVKYTSSAFDLLGQAYIDFFQLGMSATNNNHGFANSTTVRWMTDFKVANSYIGTGSASPQPAKKWGKTKYKHKY